MPFISKDWRSPGELWVKTKSGNWEKVKILQFLRSSSQELETPLSEQMAPGGSDPESVPHVQVTIRRTREVPFKNTLSEALLQLDFPSACRDTRRFSYASRVLNLLINQNLIHMGGSTQRIMLTLLEEIVAYARENNNSGCGVIKLLLADLRDSLLKYGCWGRPLGSTYLWDEHKLRIQKLNAFETDEFVYEAVDIQHLPEEVIREIILKLNHHFDLNNLSETSDFLKRIVDENRTWRELCFYHFQDEQINQMIANSSSSGGDFEWVQIYHKLKRKHGLVEKYAEEINLCKTCRTLFWPSYGHPCLSTPVLISLKPEEFIKFFSL